MAITVSAAFKNALKGPVDRSLLKVEVYFSAAWVDVTSYVEEISGVQEEVSSLTGNANANTLSLTLVNDDGRFSPRNTASPYYYSGAGLVPNKPIRVSAVYGSESVRMFTGYVSNWLPNAKSRNCQVTAEDQARILRRRDIVEETVCNTTNPTTGLYLTRVLERACYLSGLRWDAVTTKSSDWTLLDQDGNGSNEITPTYDGSATRATYTLAGVPVMALDLVDLLIPVAPLKGKALAVLDSLAKAVDGNLWFDAQGQLVFRCRMYRNDGTIASSETLSVSSLEDVTAQVNFEDAKWVQLCNRASVKSTPWGFKTDSGGNVIEEEVPFKGDLLSKYFFSAGERYPDYVADANAADWWCELPSGIRLFKTTGYPSAANMVLTSVKQTDTTNISNGIGFQASYPVFEQTRVKVALVNNGSAAEQVQTLTLKAKLMRQQNRCQSIQKNATSITTYDQRDREVTNDYIPTVSACQQLAAWLVEDGRQPKDIYTLPLMYGVPWLELGDAITVSETITNTIPAAAAAIIKRISWRWTLAAFAVTIEACSPAATFSPGSLPVTVTKVESLNQNINSTVAATLPPATVDGSQAQVGLNNLPSFEGFITPLKVDLFGGAVSLSGVFADGYLFAGYDGNSFDLTRVLPATAAAVNHTTMTTTGRQLAYTNNAILAMDNGVFAGSQTIQAIRPSDVGTGSPTNWYADGTVTPRGIYAYNGQVYLIEDLGPPSYTVRLRVFKGATYSGYSSTATYTISTGVGTGLGADARFACNNGSLYIAIPDLKRVALFSIATDTLTANWLSTGTEKPYGIAHDGINLWLSTDANKVYRYIPTANGYTQETVNVALSGGYGGALLFDGQYVWAGSQGKVYQLATTKQILLTYTVGTSSITSLVYDGQYVWALSDNRYAWRMTRLTVGRQY